MVLAAVAGVVLRVWTYGMIMSTPNADEAVVGLMARHAQHGNLTVFYWGQGYGGAQEAYLTVPVFWIFGDGWLQLRIVPILINVAAAFVVWRVGRRTVGEPAATATAALFWVWPPFAIFQLVHQQGFYASNVFYCALLLLAALRVYERPDRRRVAEFGLVLGLAFWQTVQIVPIAAGAIAWLIWKRPAALRQLPAGILGAVVGALPWIVWNLTHHWKSFEQAAHGDYFTSLRLLASPTLPMLVGLRVPLSAKLLLPSVLTYALYVAFIVLFLYGAWRSRNRPISLLYVITAVFPFLYATSETTSRVISTPRYTMVLVPVLVLLIGQVARTVPRAAALLTVAVAVSAITLSRQNDWFNGNPHPTNQVRGLGPRDTVQLVPRNLSKLIAALDRLHVDHLYTDYWLAYRLDFDSRERITAVENRLIGMRFANGKATPTLLYTRYAPYLHAVERADHSFVFYKKLVDSAAVVPVLERHGYTRHDEGAFVVFTPP